MDQPQTSLKSRILVAPLDWGLGHATRSIPIIRELIKQNAEVVLAADGMVKALLEREFPQLGMIQLKGYDVRYSKNKWTLPFTIAAQVPKIISAIEEENQRIDEIVEEHRINGIISDSRFGLFHEKIPSVFVSHQLLIKTNLGQTADELLQKLNYNFINKFSECWVPDHEGVDNLAGDLSHPSRQPSIPTTYLGPLSRMQAGEDCEQKHLLVLLSGPEPQRTILEEIMVEELEKIKNPVVMVRGLPLPGSTLQLPSHVTVYDHLPADELNKLMLGSSLVIARCGYSTVMDLAVLQKRSILIPTPGQTEQEYLSRHLMQKRFALCIDQQKFRLRPALDLSEHFGYRVGFGSGSQLEHVVRRFLVDRLTS